MSAHRSRARTSQQGFTLIELVIVVAIVGILAAVAYPSYRESVLKGRRAEARAALMELMQQQERFMTQRNTYMSFTNSAGTAAAVSPSQTSVPFKIFSGDQGTNPAYWLSASQCPAATEGGTAPAINTCVQVVATPTFTDSKVNVLTMTSTGVKACTGAASSTNPALCWP